MKRLSTRLLIIASVVALLLPVACSGPTGPSSDSGRQQLVDALDAAWVRVLDRGELRQAAVEAGMGDVMINIADCLPSPHVVPYPEEPHGLLKQILNEEKIRVGRSQGPDDPGATAYYFGSRPGDALGLILAELASHYGIGPIEVEQITIPPPYAITSVLNSGRIDIVGTVNALGGETEDLRRRSSRRFTCTLSATRQMLWVLKDGGPGWTTVDDAYKDEDAQFCAGPLSNQLAHAYFDQPGQNVFTEFGRDLDVCLARVITGESDAMVNPFPVDRFFPERVDTTGDGQPDTSTVGLFRPIDTNLVAGTPLWVQID